MYVLIWVPLKNLNTWSLVGKYRHLGGGWGWGWGEAAEGVVKEHKEEVTTKVCAIKPTTPGRLALTLTGKH